MTRWLIPGAILLFWGVMTFFLLQRTYFPQSAAGAEVPVDAVIPLMFQEDSVNHVMTLYDGRKRIGQINLATRLIAVNPSVYQMRVGGLMNMGANQSMGDIRFRHASLDFDSGGDVRRLEGELGMGGRSGMAVNFGWSGVSGQPPYVRVEQGGHIMFDSRQSTDGLTGMKEVRAQAEAMLGGMGFDLSGLDEAVAGGGAGAAAKLRWIAREGRMKAAGQMRDGFRLSAPLLPNREEVTLFVTRQGEIVQLNVGRRWVLRSLEWFPE